MEDGDIKRRKVMGKGGEKGRDERGQGRPRGRE
jgi:hypothetical protein